MARLKSVMENMSTPFVDETQLVTKNVKPTGPSLRKLSNEDQVELMKWIKPCSVILDVLQGKQNFKVRCLMHKRYECRCINRNQRYVKCLSCSGCSVQNKLTKGKKKNYRCQTKQSDMSQQKKEKKMKSLSGINKQFHKENSADETSSIAQQIPNGSTSKTLNSHDFSSSKPEDQAYHQAYKLGNVFTAVDSECVISDYLFAEDICKVSSENLFAEHKDIDYSLVKSVKLEQDVEGSSREIDISVQNSDVPVLTINDIYTNNDRLGLATNQIHPKIKEEAENDQEVSIINESIISIELHSLSKIEELPDISKNNIPVLEGSCLDELPDKSNDESETKNIFIVHRPFKAAEALQREMETNVPLQNEVQTLNGTLQSDLQIKQETNSREYEDVVQEEYVSNLSVADKNIQLNSKNHKKCQNQRKEKYESNVVKPFGCTICGKAFTEKSSLTKHKRIYTGEKPFGCTICGKAFTQQSSLRVHKRIHTGEKPFGCTICGKAFTEQSSLTRHKRVHTGEKPFGCTICGKAFKEQSNLTVHKRIHTGEKPFGCTICGKAFTGQSSLTKHKHIHSGEKPFGCTVCGKAFKEQSNLTVHKCIHTGEKPFGCTICGKAFTQHSNLTIHKRIHTGEKPFGCIVCGKAFTLHKYLTKHKHIHSGEKPFGCTVCGKAFTHHNSLTIHKRIHTGEKPFGCTICGKAFTEQSTLTVHKRIHTGEKPFGCTVCGKAFTQRSNLINHKRIHNSKNLYC